MPVDSLNYYAIVETFKSLCIFVLLAFQISANAVEEKLSPAQLQEDFTQLYQDLKSSHFNLFINVDEKDYDKYFETISKELKVPLSPLQARIKFQKFVAFGKVAHAYINFPDADYRAFRDAGGRTFPVYVNINGDTWTVSKDYSENALPEGTQITHINGQPVQQLFQTLIKYISSDTPEIAASILESRLHQYLWLRGQEQGTLQRAYTMAALRENKPVELNINLINSKTLTSKIDEDKNDTATKNDALRSFRVLKERVGYLKPGPFYNVENPTDLLNNSQFVTFVDEAFEFFLDEEVSHLIIDVRQNPGGTNSFSDPLIAWFAKSSFKFASKFLIRSSEHAQASNEKRLAQADDSQNEIFNQLAQGYKSNRQGSVFEFRIQPTSPREGKRYNGRVFVLIDRSSYSNAVSLAAIVKDYGFGSIIGEASVDFATTYASMETFSLTNSNIQVGFPKAHIIRPSGDNKAGPVFPDFSLKINDINEIAAFVLSDRAFQDGSN